MAFNSNFDILEPSAWVAALLANDYPIRPMLARTSTNIANTNIAGQVASKNKTVKIPKAVKPTGDANTYTGTYNKDNPDTEQPELSMEDVLYRSFSLDKWDQEFALPDLIDMHVLPRMENIMDTINKNYVKREADKFSIGIVDNNSGATIMDDEDVRYALKFLEERHYVNGPDLDFYVDPNGRFDLTGLSIFQEGDKRGDTSTQRSGNIMGQYGGFNFFTETVKTSTDSTSAVGDAVVAAAASVGDTTVIVDNGAGADSTADLSEGNVITFTSTPTEDDWYTVDSWDATTQTITLKEPLRAALSDADPVDGISGDNQYFYQQGSIALVTAVPGQSRVAEGAGVTRIRLFEPVNRVNFLISLEGDTSGLDVTIETLVGAKNFYEDRGGRYLRGTASKA